ncbi:MAG: glycosyltransferase [Patescibacteria group bacterium]|nr:glycosyltransferase [Patescibacteria group bacterium]
MRIAFLAHSFPYPAEKDGHTLILYHLLKELSQRHKITLFCFGDKNDRINIKCLTEFGVCVRIIERPKRSLFLYYLSKISRKMAWFQYRLFTNEMVKEVETIDNCPDFDLVCVHSPFVSAYLQYFKHKPVVFTYIDALSSWYQQFASVTANPLKKVHYLFEGHKASHLERELSKKMFDTIVVSEIDKKIISCLSPEAPISVIPNGVDLDYYRPSLTPPDPNVIIFTGTMDYPPNARAVLDFYNEVWPLLIKERPELRWLIVGKNPTLDVFELQSKDENIKVTGYVKDIRPCLWRSAVYVSPLSLGTGFKNKIIEAMACGKAIVASPTSLSGLTAEHGKHLLIANTPQEYREHIIALLAKPDRRQKLEIAARKLAELFSWSQTARQYEEVFTRVLSRHHDSKK